MTYENTPQPSNGSSEKPNSENKANIRNIITTVLILALLGTWAYIIYDKNKTKEKIEQRDSTIVSTMTMRDQLQKELDDATLHYDMLKTANSQKDSTIIARDHEIEEKKSRIQSLLSQVRVNNSQLQEARNLIASLRVDLQSYQQQIETLKGENLQLTQAKEQVTHERNLVQKNYDSAKEVIRNKEEIIDVGSTLHASNFDIVGIHEKGSKEKETSTAKKVDKLRISFDLDENLITPTGTKDIFVCITAPDGTPIGVEALGSGTFITRDGIEKMYTSKLQIEYTQNKKQHVSFDWRQNSKFSVGNYKIEVYNNGFKIGEAIRPLKKGGLFR